MATCSLRSSTAASERRWRADISGSRSIVRSWSTWPSPSNRSRSGSPTRVSSRRTCARESRHVLAGLSEDVSTAGGSAWASTARPHAGGPLRRLRQAADGRERPTRADPIVTLDTPAVAVLEDDRSLARASSAAHDASQAVQVVARRAGRGGLAPAPHAERHSALLATGRVWKTHVVSSAQPDQVAIAFGADPARELVWTWRTSPSVAVDCHSDRADCRTGRDAAIDRPTRRPEPIRVVHGESTPIEVPNLLNDPVIRRHRVAVDRLEPDTVYRYSLGDGTSERLGTVANRQDRPGLDRAASGSSTWETPRPASRAGAGCSRRPIAGIPTIDFILLAGDLVDRGNERTNWDHFFLRAAGVFDRVPLMPCVGNHEYLDMGPRLYRAFFELPRNGPTGSIPTWFITSSAATPASRCSTARWPSATRARRRRQADWLDATLEQTKASWKFVMFHHPVYPSHPWRDMPALREHWVPIFDKHHVDFVLQGHDHAYQRTYPLRGHRRVDEPGERNDLRDRGLRRQVRRPGPTRLHRSGTDRRLDLSDVRHRRASRTG